MAGTVPKTTPTSVAAVSAMTTDQREIGSCVVGEEADRKRHGEPHKDAHDSAGQRDDDRLGQKLSLISR